MGPVVSNLRRQGFHVTTKNVKLNPKLASSYNIRSVPTFVYILDGEEVRRKTGYQTEESLKSMWRPAIW